jgi:hypothetical protein
MSSVADRLHTLRHQVSRCRAECALNETEKLATGEHGRAEMKSTRIPAVVTITAMLV